MLRPSQGPVDVRVHGRSISNAHVTNICRFCNIVLPCTEGNGKMWCQDCVTQSSHGTNVTVSSYAVHVSCTNSQGYSSGA